MPKLIQTLQAVRRDIRALAEGLRTDRSRYAAGYQDGLRDALKVVQRHIRRSGDGRASS